MIFQNLDSCGSPSPMPDEHLFPDWLNFDQYTSKLDQTLLKYFQDLFQNLDNSDKSNKAILSIWKTLIHNRRLLIPRHPDGLETMTQTYLWLTTSCIVLTAALLEAIEQYCQEGEGNHRVEQIKEHLQTLQECDRSSQHYRRACQYLRGHLEKLLNPTQQQAQAVVQTNLQPLIQTVHRLPRIALFQPGQPDLATSLTRWIKSYQVWRIRDLRIPDTDAPLSLNDPLSFDHSDGGERLDQIPDGAQRLWSAPTLDNLMNGDLIDELMRNQVSKQATFIEQYINSDPDGHLKANFPKGHENCHYQLLAQRLILKEPPDTIKAIAQQFGIEYTKLYSVITGKDRMSLYNLLPALLIDAYPQPEALQQAILDDFQQNLESCHVKNYPECHAQFLAVRRLKLFVVKPRSFAEIAAELQQNYGYNKLTAGQIETHWYKKCLHRIGQVIRGLSEQEEVKLSGGKS